MFEDDCRYLMVRYLRRYIFESSDGENKRTPRGLLKALQCKPEGLELLDVAQCCYNLTTKELRVERTSAPSTWPRGNSLRPTPLRKEGACPSAYFAKRWQDRNDLAQTHCLARSEGRRKQTLQSSGQERQPIDSSEQLGENSPRIPCESVDFDQTRPTQRGTCPRGHHQMLQMNLLKIKKKLTISQLTAPWASPYTHCTSGILLSQVEGPT